MQQWSIPVLLRGGGQYKLLSPVYVAYIFVFLNLKICPLYRLDYRPSQSHSATESQPFEYSVQIFRWSAVAWGPKPPWQPWSIITVLLFDCIFLIPLCTTLSPFPLFTVEDHFAYDRMALEPLHVLIFCPSNLGSVHGYAFMALCLIKQRRNSPFFTLYQIVLR